MIVLVLGFIVFIFRKQITKNAISQRERFFKIKFSESQKKQWEIVVLCVGSILITIGLLQLLGIKNILGFKI